MSNALTVTVPEGLPFVDFEREFDAPVAAVFAAHADPAAVAQWMGPDGSNMQITEWDFRTGGSWSYHSEHEGVRYAFRGTFHSVRENEFAVQTFEFLTIPDLVSIESMTFTELPGGRSKLSGHSVYPSLAARDGMVGGGMEVGLRQGYDRLEKLAQQS